jgi:tRNA(Ile2) C34 agmatinyltransferase TiaS
MSTSTLIAPARDREIDEPTLDEAIARVWGRIMSARDVRCPWCGGTMHPRYSAGPLPVGARCESCGSSLT